MRTIIKLDITKYEADIVWRRWKKENPDIYRNRLIRCAICGTKEHLGIHHKDGNRINNSEANQICMCFDCHSKHHRDNFIVQYIDPYKERRDALLAHMYDQKKVRQ